MIVDLMRNDLGRLARTRSVRVTDLFTVETFRSLHQMTSGVMAELRDDIDVPMMLRALFRAARSPAREIRAMESSASWRPRRAAYTRARSAC